MTEGQRGDQPVDGDDWTDGAAADVGPDVDAVDGTVVDETVLEQTVVGSDGTGNPRIAEAVARLRELGDSPPEQHIEVYEELHLVLQETLSDAQQPADGTSGQGSTGDAQR